MTKRQKIRLDISQATGTEYQRTRFAILQTIAAICTKYGKRYTWANMETIRELLFLYYNIQIGRRTLWWHIQILVSKGLITRHFRADQAHGGTGKFLSYLTMFTAKGINLIDKLGRWGQKVAAKLKDICRPNPWRKPSTLGREFITKKITNRQEVFNTGTAKV